MNTYPFIIIISGFLIMLWAYSSFSKLMYMQAFRHAMLIQVFPKWVGKVLTYILPAIELAMVILLIFNRTRIFGMYASLFLMGLFTLYVGGAVFKFYDRTPCACGSLFGRLGWRRHLKVNIGLTLVALAGVVLMEWK